MRDECLDCNESLEDCTCIEDTIELPNQALIDAAERYIVEHNYLQGFINQFEEEGEHQELSNDDWTVSRFLEWMKLNNFKIVKTIYSVDDYKRDLKEKVRKAIDVIQELPIDEVSKQGGISALKLILNE